MLGKEIVREWLEKAEEDFEFAATALELEFRPVHNLLDLLEICKTKESRITELEEACRYLNPFYIDTRYPVHWPTQYDKANAVKARDAAEKIGRWIKDYLGFY